MRDETDDERLERLRAKGARLRRFAELERQAYAALQRPRPRTPKPQREKPPSKRRGARLKDHSARRGPTGRPVTRPERCVGCNKPLCSRQNRTEGAVVHAGHGLCTSCEARARRSTTRHVLRATTPPVCRECGTGLRSRRAPAAPGTRRHAGRGLCTACYVSAQRQVAA